MTNICYLQDWTNPIYQKKCASANEVRENAKKMKKRFKFFEFSLVFNIGFFVTAFAFTILFRFDKDTTIFTLYLLGVLCLNIYGYCYTKKELTRLMKNIKKSKELECKRW